jgi:hypothetical protein
MQHRLPPDGGRETMLKTIDETVQNGVNRE